jgi:hypothetical protein
LRCDRVAPGIAFRESVLQLAIDDFVRLIGGSMDGQHVTCTRGFCVLTKIDNVNTIIACRL